MALVQRRTEPRNAVEIGETERHQGGVAAIFADFVIEFFQPALRSRHRDDVSATFRQGTRGGVSDAARSAGDESDAVGEREGHSKETLSASLEGRDPYSVTVVMQEDTLG